MEKICGIYCIENIINHKKYIGQSVDIYRRWKQHKYELINHKHCNQHFQLAWDKYKEKNFIFTIIKECIESELDYYESLFIQKFNTTNGQYGYNLDSGGNNNKHLSIETCQKISDYLSGVNNPFYGKYHTDEVLEKLSQKVYCPELNIVFKSESFAERELRINTGGIASCLSGKQRSAGTNPSTGEPLRWFKINIDGNIIGDINEKYINKSCKEVYCIELDRIFKSTREVERILGITHNCVSANCSGKQNAVIYPVTGEKIHFVYASELQDKMIK